MTAKELREKYEKDIKELQESCKHEELSDWVNECWAPGHMSGSSVKTCQRCEKVMQTQQKMVPW